MFITSCKSADEILKGVSAKLKRVGKEELNGPELDLVKLREHVKGQVEDGNSLPNFVVKSLDSAEATEDWYEFRENIFFSAKLSKA